MRRWPHAVRAAALLALALIFGGGARAAGTCTITGVVLAGQTYTNAALNATGTVNYRCTRTSNAVDGNRITFNVTAGPGVNYLAGSRRVANGGNAMAYSLITGVAAWGDGVTTGLGNANVVTVNFTTNSASGSFTFTFQMAAALNPLTGRTYTDSAAVGGTCTTAKATPCSVTPGTLAASVTAATTCSIVSPPASVALAYAAFQAAAAQANRPFTVNCSNGGPYRMSVSPVAGTAAGIAYGLKLGTAANGATDISSTTAYNLAGTGAAVTYYVNATAAAGQAGTCALASCTQSGPSHTLLLEY
ncbi:spore coat protein U domain-containing protein [Ramlibacter humi]|uniref:Spore coat protein U domain-containing protein n=1 Tax=Ramlibacter humi TaxID=2530451 RepID=A0A4Z0BZ84_9BURK|nr:spore coat protein U domain-containing protein [Ramlibacter humi]TFZ03590.1 hypothetical protein EZ216_07930 [Ramlibacter humi]